MMSQQGCNLFSQDHPFKSMDFNILLVGMIMEQSEFEFGLHVAISWLFSTLGRMLNVNEVQQCLTTTLWCCLKLFKHILQFLANWSYFYDWLWINYYHRFIEFWYFNLCKSYRECAPFPSSLPIAAVADTSPNQPKLVCTYRANKSCRELLTVTKVI